MSFSQQYPSVQLSRRAVLTGLGAVASSIALAACSTPDPQPTATASPSVASPTPTPTPTPPPEPRPALPGGGTRVFPGRRLVALYGTPNTPALGALGEQGLEESIERAQALAEEYRPFSREPVIPTFEIISTVATAHSGPTDEYTSAVDLDVLTEWVTAAGEADVYVVLDLQPGLADFLSQARMFEDLLRLPHVGLALDPEWRLKPGQRHMRQIGQVEAAEINETSQWLSDLVEEQHLPEKLFLLHQFQTRMIPDRHDVVDRPGLATLVHADGHGTPGQKLDTYRALRADLPPHMRLGWKNFIDEDLPTFTPEETMDVVPKPWFVSYQ